MDEGGRGELHDTVINNNASIDAPQDTPYLTALIEEIEAEMKEREDLDSMQINKKISS